MMIEIVLATTETNRGPAGLLNSSDPEGHEVGSSRPVGSAEPPDAEQALRVLRTAPRPDRPAHVPVLLEEVLATLDTRPGGTYIDCTVGLGGHAAAILHRSGPNGRLLAIDSDPASLAVARANLKDFTDRVVLANGNFGDMTALALTHGFHRVDGILLDLGPSSFQLSTMGRGFSFQSDTPLDMRYDPRDDITAEYLVNHLSEMQLADVLYRYGEEYRSRVIARHIMRTRGHKTISTTAELAAIVAEALGGRRGRLHPATKTFLALRIAVNRELENLSAALPQAVDLLSPAGRLAIITFHSLEDRIVKHFIRARADLKPLARKPIRASEGEIGGNPRARSAKLRAAERSA